MEEPRSSVTTESMMWETVCTLQAESYPMIREIEPREMMCTDDDSPGELSSWDLLERKPSLASCIVHKGHLPLDYTRLQG